MQRLLEIEKILAGGQVKEALEQVLALLEQEPNHAAAWYLLGGIYRREQLWGEAINAYNRAKMIEPEGPAAAVIDSIYDIIRFVNKDLMNP